MKRKAAIASAILVSTLALSSTPALAATTFDVSSSSPNVGDTVTVNVRSDSTETVTVTYDNSKLDVAQLPSGATVSGNVITLPSNSGKINFTAKNSGSAPVVISTGGQKQSSGVLNVAASQQQTTTEETKTETENKTETTEEQTEEQVKTGNKDFTIGETAYTLSERFKDTDVPAGFSVVRQKIHNYEYKVLKSDASGMVLVYLKDASDISKDGSFYVYDEASDSVSPLQMIGSKDSYVILGTADELLQSNMDTTDVQVGDSTYSMYQIPDDNSGFYYVYGTDQNGDTQWFQYDSQGGTIQRVNESLFKEDKVEEKPAEETIAVEDEGEDTKEAAKVSLLERIQSLPKQVQLGGLIGIALVLLGLILAIVLKARKKSKPAYDPDQNDEMIDLGSDSEDADDTEISLDTDSDDEDTEVSLDDIPDLQETAPLKKIKKPEDSPETIFWTKVLAEKEVKEIQAAADLNPLDTYETDDFAHFGNDEEDVIPEVKYVEEDEISVEEIDEASDEENVEAFAEEDMEVSEAENVEAADDIEVEDIEIRLDDEETSDAAPVNEDAVEEAIIEESPVEESVIEEAVVEEQVAEEEEAVEEEVLGETAAEDTSDESEIETVETVTEEITAEVSSVDTDQQDHSEMSMKFGEGMQVEEDLDETSDMAAAIRESQGVHQLRKPTVKKPAATEPKIVVEEDEDEIPELNIIDLNDL